MILTKYQRDFAIDNIKKIVDNSTYYTICNLTFITQVEFQTKKEFLKFHFDIGHPDVLTKCELTRNNYTMTVSRDKSPDFDYLDKMVKSKMRQIDDWKFSQIFPEYDISHKREEILEEILPKETDTQLDNPKKIGKFKNIMNIFNR